MAKQKIAKSNSDESKYVRLLIHSKRRAFTVFTTVALTFLFSTWVWANLAQKRGDQWFMIALPLIFIGLLTNFILPVEEWNYGPWQDSTQKYEKNIYD
jgi:hypothetical protein